MFVNVVCMIVPTCDGLVMIYLKSDPRKFAICLEKIFVLPEFDLGPELLGFASSRMDDYFRFDFDDG